MFSPSVTGTSPFTIAQFPRLPSPALGRTQQETTHAQQQQILPGSPLTLPLGIASYGGGGVRVLEHRYSNPPPHSKQKRRVVGKQQLRMERRSSAPHSQGRGVGQVQGLRNWEGQRQTRNDYYNNPSRFRQQVIPSPLGMTYPPPTTNTHGHVQFQRPVVYERDKERRHTYDHGYGHGQAQRERERERWRGRRVTTYEETRGRRVPPTSYTVQNRQHGTRDTLERYANSSNSYVPPPANYGYDDDERENRHFSFEYGHGHGHGHGHAHAHLPGTSRSNISRGTQKILKSQKLRQTRSNPVYPRPQGSGRGGQQMYWESHGRNRQGYSHPPHSHSHRKYKYGNNPQNINISNYQPVSNNLPHPSKTVPSPTTHYTYTSSPYARPYDA